MPYANNRRLPMYAVVFAALLLIPLTVEARPPTPNRDAAESAGGQEITDVGLDPTGRFAAVVVRYENTRGINPGGLLGGTQPTSTTARDIYRCDLGPATQPRSGEGCRGVSHAGATAGTSPSQSVDVTSYSTPGGLTPVFAVAGPGDTASFWHFSSDQPRWPSKTMGDPVVNASVSPDGARLAFAMKGSAATRPSRVAVYEASGSLVWDVWLNDSSGNPVDPTALTFSRDGRLLVIGTTKGLLFADPYGAKPANTKAMSPIDTDGAVRDVALTRTASGLVAGTANGIYYVPLAAHRPSGGVWNRGVPDGVTGIALSLDGDRFAAASGNRVLFYRHIGGAFIAEQLPDAFDAGAPVADLAYSASGDLLVAAAGENVHAFGPHTNKPLWSFKATDPSRGALDGPLRKVRVSDGGERVLVAGRTKFLAYTNVVTATAAFAAAPGPITPARPMTLPLTLTNTGSLPDNYTLVVKAPVGWTTSTLDNLALDPDASRVVNLTVEAPPGAAPGLYGVSVEARSRAANGAVAASAQSNLTLPRAITLAIEMEEEKVTLPRGEEAQVQFTVRNLGNAEGVVNLSATQTVTQGASWTARFSEDQVRIAPGASEALTLTLDAPPDAVNGVRNTVTIRAREGDVEAAKTFTAYVDPEFGAVLTTSNDTLEFRPGESRTLTLTVRNSGNTEDVFNVTYTLTPPLAAGDWKVTLAEDLKVTLAQGGTRTLSIAIRPAVAQPRDATLTLRAISQGSPELEEFSAPVALASIPAEPTEEPEEGNPLPFPSPLALLACLGAAALLLRRGGLR